MLRHCAHMKKRIAFTSRFGLTLFALVALEAACDRVHAQPSPAVLSTNTQPAIKMNQFVIIFRQGPRKLTEAELARRQQEVSAWARTQTRPDTNSNHASSRQMSSGPESSMTTGSEKTRGRSPPCCSSKPVTSLRPQRLPDRTRRTISACALRSGPGHHRWRLPYLRCPGDMSYDNRFNSCS